MAKVCNSRNGQLYLCLGSRGKKIKSQGDLWLLSEFSAWLFYNGSLSKYQNKERHIKRERTEEEEEKSFADFFLVLQVFVMIFWLLPVCQSLHALLRIRCRMHSVCPPESCYVLMGRISQTMAVQQEPLCFWDIKLENLHKCTAKNTIRMKILKAISEK